MAWQKLPKAPYYLEIWEGKRKTSYRVNFRAEGVNLRRKLAGSFASWKDALREADRLISEKRFGKKDEVEARVSAGQGGLVRSEDLVKQLMAESRANDRASTQALKTIIHDKHMLPWLNEHFPYAQDFNTTTWPTYKAFRRAADPKCSLYNHANQFRKLFNRAFELGIIPKKITLKFDVKREDFRKKGLIIPQADYEAIIAAATPKHMKRAMPKWRDRIILQRRTGMRPGEVRNLEKKDVRLFDAYAVVHIPAEKEKRWGERHFRVRDPEALEILRRRLERVESRYLFPSEKDPSKPVDKHLSGWKAILRRAKVNPEYTPHDLRHSYASEMFQKTDKFAQLCFQLGMSLETAQEVYLHLTEEDTDEIAELASREVSK